MPPTSLAAALVVHDQLAALCQRVSDARFMFRTPTPSQLAAQVSGKSERRVVIHQDKIVCALMVKVLNTKHAIVALAQAGHGDDAYALARVIVENSVIVAWLLDEDWPTRVDAYGLFIAAHRARLRDLLAKYWDKATALTIGDEMEAIAKDLFDGGWTKWAKVPVSADPGRKTSGRFIDLCRDLTPPKEGGDRSSMLYEVAYYDASTYIHSAPPSIQEIAGNLATEYRLQPMPSDTRCALALHLSNISTWFAIKALNNWLNADLGDDLATLESKMRSQSRSV